MEMGKNGERYLHGGLDVLLLELLLLKERAGKEEEDVDLRGLVALAFGLLQTVLNLFDRHLSGFFEGNLRLISPHHGLLAARANLGFRRALRAGRGGCLLCRSLPADEIIAVPNRSEKCCEMARDGQRVKVTLPLDLGLTSQPKCEADRAGDGQGAHSQTDEQPVVADAGAHRAACRGRN